MDTSQNFSLNKTDLLKIAKGAAVAVAGAILVYLAQIIPHINFGIWTPIVVALASVLVNAGHKWAVSNQ